MKTQPNQETANTMNTLPDGTRKYADLLTIVKAGLVAQGRDDDDDAYGHVDDYVQGLLAYAAAMDLTEKRAGGADGVVVPEHVAQAEHAAYRFWHKSNTADILDKAEAFAEGFVENA